MKEQSEQAKQSWEEWDADFSIQVLLNRSAVSEISREAYKQVLREELLEMAREQESAGNRDTAYGLMLSVNKIDSVTPKKDL